MTLLQQFKKDYRGKKVLIFGLGILGGGINDAILFAKVGAKVRITDLKSKIELQTSLKKLKNYPIKYIFEKHRKKDILWADIIIRNPSVPKESPFLKFAKKHNKKVAMAESLFIEYFGSEKIIGVTGTRGKTTTSTWIYHLLKDTGLRAHIAGNIQGVSTLSLIEKARKDDFIVLELSSWQLEGLEKAKISPHIAVITSIYEDHLNRYPSMKEYIKSKKAIFQHQTKKDFLVLNKDQILVRQLARKAKSKLVWFTSKDCPSNWHLKLKGRHNRSNAGAVIKIGKILKLPQSQIKKTIINFKGVPFRLEKIAQINGTDYINDTTSTTPAAGIAALDSFDQPTILIAGGNSKNLNMNDFAKLIAKKVKKVIFLEGTGTDELISLIKKYGGKAKIGEKFKDLKKAVLRAKSLSQPGEVVLLSPGLTSFGTFVNEFDRGEKFNKVVMEFKNAQKTQ